MAVNYTDQSDTSRARPPQEDSTLEQVQWEELEEYVGSSDEYVGSSDEDHTSENHLLGPPHDRFRGGLTRRSQTYVPEHLQDRDHARSEDRPQQMVEVRSSRWASLERLESAVTEPSVGPYEGNEDVQWWHNFVGKSHSEWDEVQVIAFIAFMVLVCFIGAVMVWVMVN